MASNPAIHHLVTAFRHSQSTLRPKMLIEIPCLPGKTCRYDVRIVL